MSAFLRLSKGEQLRALKSLRDNNTFQWLLIQFYDDVRPYRDQIFDVVPQTVGELLEREQSIGRSSQATRVGKLLDDVISELENETKNEAPA